MRMKRTPFVIVRYHPAANLAVMLMALSAAVRLLYFTIRGIESMSEAVVHLALPVLAALSFIAALTLGERYSRVTALSVLLGVIFFILKSFTFESAWHTGLCILLYLTVLALYTATVFGILPTNRLLIPLFGLPLIYHVFVEDVKLYILADPPVPFVEWLPEISVLLIMASLLSVSFAMRKKAHTEDGNA